MRKKDTLYTANKWNKPLFMPRENLFYGDPSRSSQMQNSPNTLNGGMLRGVTATGTQSKDPMAFFGLQSSNNPFVNAGVSQYMSNYGKGTMENSDEKAVGPLNFKEAFSKRNINKGFKAGAGAIASAGAGILGNIAGNAISGGLHSGAGDTIGTVGSTVGTAIGAVNPLLGTAVNVGSQLLGGLANAAFGTKVDESKLNAAKEGTFQLNNFVSNAGSFDDIQGIQSVAAVNDPYKGGWFSSGKARRKNEELQRQREQAMAFAQNSLTNNINNIAEDQINNALANYSAFGGFLGRRFDDGGLIGDGGVPSDTTWHEQWLTGRQPQFNENYGVATEQERQRFVENNSSTIPNQLDNLRNTREYSDKEAFIGALPGQTERFKGASGAVRNGGSNNVLWSVGIDGYDWAPHDTTQHERTHALSRIPADLSTYTGVEMPQHSKIRSINDKYKDNLYAPSDLDYTDDEGVFHPFNAPDPYLDTPDEIYSELNEFRKRAGLAPDYKVTRDDLLRWRNAEGMQHLNDTLSRFNDDVLLEYFNDVAYNPIVGDSNMAAYGGLFDIDNNDGMSAIDYGFMSDYLNTKKKQAEQKNQMTNMFMGTPKGMFAIGGDMQTNSSDFSTGLTHINAGGSHEESPYDGVQMGVDQNGVPNLVEEGEVVYNDYVYSNRIELDEEAKAAFHFPKKKDMTYAEAAKKLEKEIAERPNDPISEAGFKAQMEALAEHQERQKQEMEAERAKAAFETLSPEEQVAVMENAAQQEQMAQEAAMQQEAMAQQQAQPSPEEQAMMQADGSQAMVGQEAPMMAEGGHLFDEGGEMKKLFYKLIGVSTDSDYKAWLKKNNLDELKDAEDWENILDNKAIMSVVTKDNPALAHAIENKYDFGLYKPGTSGNISFDDDRGNWDAQTVQGWWGSNDPAWKQVIEAHPELTKDTNLTREQLAEYLRSTDAFKRGTQWLQDSEDNRLAYLQRIINNPNAPKRAREYALRFADANGWKQNAARDYETIFNNPSGRAANPGTYWKTPIEVARGSQTGNFVINDDGTVEPIIGDVPANWTEAGNYSWATPESDYAYNYYRRPAAAADAAKTPEQKTAEEVKAKEEARRILPVHTNQLFGIEDIGPLISMGMMAADIGRPDTGSLYSAVRGAGNVALADWMPRGDFAIYKPDDPWFYTSPIIAQSNATQRAINNTVSPSKHAASLANGYNTMTALGQAQRQQLDSNFDKYMKVKQYNGSIYGDNQKEYGQTSRFNASALNDAAGRQAQLGLTAAREAMDADAAWNQNWYGNVGALTKSIGARRKENRTRNMIADMAATGLFGNMNPDTFIANGMLRYETDEERRKRLGQSAAEGGNIRRKKGKRGLTL